jgi:hypothetical protein
MLGKHVLVHARMDILAMTLPTDVNHVSLHVSHVPVKELHVQHVNQIKARINFIKIHAFRIALLGKLLKSMEFVRIV